MVYAKLRIIALLLSQMMLHQWELNGNNMTHSWAAARGEDSGFEPGTKHTEMFARPPSYWFIHRRELGSS